MYTFVFSVLAETDKGTHMLQMAVEAECVSDAKMAITDYLENVWGYWDIQFAGTLIVQDFPLIITSLKLPG